MAERSGFHFELPTTMDVECSGPSSPRSVLIAYHGYAESPLTMIEAFERSGICDRHLVVAPWAPHQFYNRSDEVVGSWMTRHQRDRQSAWLCQHARRLWEEIERRVGTLPLNLFGFSQGGANAYRVGMLAGLPSGRVFVLAGDLPPECRAGLLDGAASAGPPVVQLWGLQDRRVPLEVQRRDSDLMAASGYPHISRTAPGGHEMLPELLACIGEMVEQDH